jgi:hypothetical protein
LYAAEFALFILMTDTPYFDHRIYGKELPGTLELQAADFACG